MLGGLFLCLLVVLARGDWLLPSFDVSGTRLFPSSPSNSTLACASGGADVLLSWPTAANNQLLDAREVEMSPLIDGNAIYVISADNTNVTAIDPISWKMVWSVNVVGNTTNKILSPLSIQNDVIYLVVGDRYFLAHAVVLALDSKDGRRVWSTPNSSDYSIRASTLVPHKNGFLLAYALYNNTYALIALRPANSTHFEDYLVWRCFVDDYSYESYITPPVLSVDEENIFFIIDKILYDVSPEGDIRHKFSFTRFPFFSSARMFVRKDNVVVLVGLATKGTDVFYRTFLIDVINNVSTTYDNVKVLCLGPNQSMVSQNKTLLTLTTYHLNETIWTKNLDAGTDAIATVDSNGVVYVGAFAESDDGSYISAFRLSDGKQYWVSSAQTPLQWSISHFKGEYLLLLQSRGSMGKISNQNYCSPTGGTCTEDECACKPDYFGKGCFTFCDNNITCENFGICDTQGHCQYFCDNTTFCNNRASSCVNATCTCKDEFWTFYKYTGERCETESLNIPFIGTIGGLSFALVLLVLLIIITCCRRSNYTQLN